MADEKQILNIDEQKTVAEIILRIVAEYPHFPKSITKEKIRLDTVDELEDIGIVPTAGAIVTKKYISGSFEAQFPFSILYKCNPTNNKAVIDKRELLEKLCKWMNEMEYSSITNGREILSIEQTTNVVRVWKDDSGASIFQCGCRLKYYMKKELLHGTR